MALHKIFWYLKTFLVFEMDVLLNQFLGPPFVVMLDLKILQAPKTQTTSKFQAPKFPTPHLKHQKCVGDPTFEFLRGEGRRTRRNFSFGSWFVLLV